MMNKKMKIRQFFWLFVIGSVIGFLIENCYSWILLGDLSFRRGLVLGPFTPIYGFGTVIFTLFLKPLRRENPVIIFFFSSLLGEIIEFTGSLIEELILGIKMWDFSQQPFNLAGRTSLIYMFFWGVIGVFYLKFLYPFLIRLINHYLIQQRMIYFIFIAFFIMNFTLSGLAINRWTERQSYQKSDNQIDKKLDHQFHDDYLTEIFPNLELAEQEE
ncbi:putative ABC transporter permease [Enterococcus sp. AZ103]|uniref:putative ABC transporter permease n=1 Tax=Enterococcus sp. AZ103 TaxID=2774628 RepID=UPI003F1F4551